MGARGPTGTFSLGGFGGGQVTCFVAGTLIRTPDGERRIEDLDTGDVVETASGPREIRWIGRRRLDPRRHANPELAQPVRIAAHAFGENLPARDLYLSPRHCVAQEGVIIPVEVLVDGAAVTRMEWSTVEYFRLELDEHDLVWAEGLPAESYMYAGLRSDYDNQDGPMTLHPTFSYAPEEDTCLPLVVAGPEVERVRARLTGRARTGLGARLARRVLGQRVLGKG